MPQPQILLKPIHPKIDFGNPITQGLVFDAPFYEGSGVSRTKEIITNLDGTIVASGATWDKSFYGNDIDFSAAASSVNFVPPAMMNSMVRMSYEFMFFSRGSGGGALGKIFQKGNTGNAPYVLIQQSSSATILEFLANWGSTTGNWTWTIVGSTWYHLIVTYDVSSTSNNPIVYLNAVPQTLTKTGTPTGTAPPDTANMYIGNSAANTRNFNGKILYGRGWARILTPGEAWSLYSNPWQIYVKPNFLPYYISPVAAATTYQTTRMMMGFGM